MAERRAFAVAIFCRNAGEILLVRHKRLDLWLPVGGEVEPGETPLEAARRELREETGLEGTFPSGLGVALTELGAAQRSRRGRFKEPSQGSCRIEGSPPGLIGYEEHPAGSKGLHMNFAFVADVATRELAACDEYTAVRWVGDPVPVACPLNVQQLVRLALAAR
ncbi:MAG: NUDIX domain-containing protein [Polyangia bacterium]